MSEKREKEEEGLSWEEFARVFPGIGQPMLRQRKIAQQEKIWESKSRLYRIWWRLMWKLFKERPKWGR